MRNLFLISATALVLSANIGLADEVVNRQIVFKTASEDISHTGKNLSGASAELQLISNKVLIETIRHCDITEGNGSSSNWGGFFNAKKEDKAGILAELIIGVGKPTAERMIELGTFKDKPDSWKLFKDRIRQADAQINGNLYKNVIEDNGAKNKDNLGYQKIKTCNDSDVSTVVARISRTVHLNIQGAPLLSGESETLTVSMKGNDDNQVALSFSPATTNYNHYTIMSNIDNPYNNHAEIVVRGTRIQVTPSNTLDVSINSVGTSGSITVRNTAFDPETTPTSGAKIRVTVTDTKGSWKSIFSSDTTLDTREFDLNTSSSDTLITGLKMNASEGKHVELSYTLEYTSSPYYNMKATSSKEVSSK